MLDLAVVLSFDHSLRTTCPFGPFWRKIILSDHLGLIFLCVVGWAWGDHLFMSNFPPAYPSPLDRQHAMASARAVAAQHDDAASTTGSLSSWSEVGCAPAPKARPPAPPTEVIEEGEGDDDQDLPPSDPSVYGTAPAPGQVRGCVGVQWLWEACRILRTSSCHLLFNNWDLDQKNDRC